MGGVETFISQLLFSTVRTGTPLLAAGLGELYGERAGMRNIGLDGIMVLGAFCGWFASYSTQSPVIGVIVGGLAGVAINMIYAATSVSLKADQIVMGMALGILCTGVAAFLFKLGFGISDNLVGTAIMKPWPVPGLSKIPFIGHGLFEHAPLVYVIFLLVPITAWFFNKTKFGLNYRSVGENPKAADSLGINVVGVKYLGCILCGLLAGIAGAFFTTCWVESYNDGLIVGRGYIALAAVIFGRWSPVGIMGASMLFALADAAQARLQIMAQGVPYQWLAMIPYVLTIVALAIMGGKRSGPKAMAKPYYKEER